MSASFVLGRPRADNVTIEVTSRSHPGARDYWDGNWVNVRVTSQLGAFRATINASLRTTDFQSFREQLETLSCTLRGEARFETIEDWVTIRVAVDGSGHLDVQGELTDNPGSGNRLHFGLTGLDQTFLPAMIASLREIEGSYPNVGSAAV